MTAGADGSLIFRLSKPAAAKPALHNVIAQSNAAPSLFRPVIGPNVQEAKPGDQIVVRGSNFSEPEATRIVIRWDHTVSTEASTTEIDWGVAGEAVQKVSTNQGGFEFDNLKSGTSYQFKVHECDPVTCAPWSDTLTVTTSAAGTDQALIWLDNASSARIGTATVDSSGSFSATATIPASTTPGQHTIHASIGEPPQATPIVFPLGGPIILGSTLAVTNLKAGPVSASAAADAKTPLEAVKPVQSLVITPVAAPIKPVGVGSQSPILVNSPTGITTSNPQQASATITVCAASGCVPTISLINSATNTVQPAPGQVENTFPVTLRGDGFLPNQPVTVFIDSPTGTKVGAAGVAASGTFQATFTMPSVQGGNHQFVAVETSGGKTVQASVPVFVQMLPQ